MISGDHFSPFVSGILALFRECCRSNGAFGMFRYVCGCLAKSLGCEKLCWRPLHLESP